MLQEDIQSLAEAIFLNIQYILFALEENAIHRYYKPADLSTAFNPYRFGPPTDNPHRHRRKEEEASYLHTEDIKSKY
jgi:hypothetical protein